MGKTHVQFAYVTKCLKDISFSNSCSGLASSYFELGQSVLDKIQTDSDSGQK